MEKRKIVRLAKWRAEKRFGLLRYIDYRDAHFIASTKQQRHAIQSQRTVACNYIIIIDVVDVNVQR